MSTNTDADRPITDTMGHEFSTIYVGPIRKKYAVHKALLVQSSGFFKKALQGNIQEATTNEIWLEEDEPEGFEIFVHKLYRNEFPQSTMKVETAEQEEVSFKALINYYILASKLLLPISELVKVLDVLFDLRLKAHGSISRLVLFPAHLIKSALSRIASDDPLRKMLCDFAAISLSDSYDREAELVWLSAMDLTTEELHEMLVDTKQFWGWHDAKLNLQSLRSERSVQWTERYQTGFLTNTEMDSDIVFNSE